MDEDLCTPGIPLGVALAASQCRERGANVHVEFDEYVVAFPVIIEIYNWPEDMQPVLEKLGFYYRSKLELWKNRGDDNPMHHVSEAAWVWCRE